MRLALICCVALASSLVVPQPPAAAAPARASLTTLVLPAAEFMIARPFQPDSAAPPESTTFLQFVGICPASGCGRPICHTDSIVVSVGGSFPNNCYFVRRIDLYYPPIVSIRPFAPWVRVIVDDGACLEWPCISGRFPWSGSITMPPLPEGPYTLSVAVIPVSCSDSVPPPPWDMKSFEFSVTRCDSSPPPFQCLLTSWDPHTPFDGDRCDVAVTPTDPARLTLKLGTRVALAGLQGSFELQPAVLRITNIEAVGPATGMRVTWAQTGTGAQFVMFSDVGASIPPTPPDGSHEPVLTLTISAPAGATIPPSTDLLMRSLLGSDPEGSAVPPCPIIALTDAAGNLVYVPPPRICSVGDCDFNRDSFTDVRDLVLMVHCLYLRSIAGTEIPHGLCPNFFDCNGDSMRTLDDVLCCAWKILRAQPCPGPYGCDPDTAPPHVDLNVRVSVGLPVADGNDVRVPIHVDGADRIGAARLAMRFPTDRWRVAGFESDDPAWFTLAGEERGEAVMGAIRSSPETGPTELNLTLRLQSIGGAPAGGELGALQADLSATDGVRLKGTVLAPVRPLPGRVVELSENRPEPFSGRTQFTLSLPVAAVADLGVFDLGGRRIATLHHGPLKAGPSEFSWAGRLDGGGRARGGVYFYRAVVDGQAVSRRMVFLGDR